jgi:hypothetical protein
MAKRKKMVAVAETALRNIKSNPERELEKLMRLIPETETPGVPKRPGAFKKDKDTPAAQTFTPRSYTKIQRNKRGGRKRQTPRT